MRNRLAIKKRREKTYRKNEKKNKMHTRKYGRKNRTRRQGRKNRTRRRGDKNRTRRRGHRNLTGGEFITFKDGSEYDGDIRDGKMHGEGIMMMPDIMLDGEIIDGDKYAGEWNRGKMHGEGTFTRSNGEVWIGNWKNGIFQKGFVTYPNGAVKRINNINTTLHQDLSSQFSQGTAARANLDLLDPTRPKQKLKSDELTRHLSKTHKYFGNKI